MVKISIKKDKKTKTKRRQKQKQKQSQKVIVNIGSNAVKARRATTQPIQKNVANKQMPTPNIYVPQSNPLYKQSDSTSEILKYIKESEQQKELIKKQEKSNELEKDILNSQWRDSSSLTGALGPIIPLVDVSGSMRGDPLHAAIARSTGLEIFNNFIKIQINNAVMTSKTTPSALAAPQLKKISMSLAIRLDTMMTLPPPSTAGVI